MITEDYVPYEIAKLLKEKGFKNEYCDNMLLAEDGDTIWKFATFTNRDDAFDATMKFKKQIPLVTHQMALKWLREVHRIETHIVLSELNTDNSRKYMFDIYSSDINKDFDSVQKDGFNSYEQAVEAACLWVLKNLL